jgi:hypothetical protein
LINLTDYIIAWWHFNDSFAIGDQGYTDDSGPNGYNATTNGGSLVDVPGKLSNCAQSSGAVGQYFDVADITQIDGADELSICCWVKGTDAIGADEYVVDRWASQLLIYADKGASYDNWRGLVRNSDGTAYGNTGNENNAAVIVPGAWQWLCITFKQNDYCRFYVNNTLISEQATADLALANASGIIRLMGDKDGGKNFHGYLDELVILSHALTATERNFLWNSGAGREVLESEAIEEAIYYLLSNDATVSGLVGTRIYPMVVPRNAAMPAIAYQQISGVREHTMTGPIGMVKARFQINCWAETYATADAIAEAVRKELDGYSGVASDTWIYDITLLQGADKIEVLPGVDVLTTTGKRLDFLVWYKEY